VSAEYDDVGTVRTAPGALVVKAHRDWWYTLVWSESVDEMLVPGDVLSNEHVLPEWPVVCHVSGDR